MASEHGVRTAKSFGAGWHVLCTQSETLFACLDLPLQPGWEIYHHPLSSPSPTLSSPFVPPVSLDINGPTDPTPSLLSPPPFRRPFSKKTNCCTGPLDPAPFFVFAFIIAGESEIHNLDLPLLAQKGSSPPLRLYRTQLASPSPYSHCIANSKRGRGGMKGKGKHCSIQN